MARPYFRPIIFALKRAPTWPGIILDPPEAPYGYALLTDDNGVLLTDDDNRPLIVPKVGFSFNG